MTLGEGIEAAPITEITFWILSFSTVISAIAVVQLRDLFRSALFLIVTFIGVAGLFILLRAEFLAAVQVLIYVGAISVLIIFAILMTKDLEEGSAFHTMRMPLAIIAIIFMGLAIYSISSTNWNTLTAGNIQPSMNNLFANTVPSLAKLLLRDFLLAFEAESVFLLAVVIGALALVRER